VKHGCYVKTVTLSPYSLITVAELVVIFHKM